MKNQTCLTVVFEVVCITPRNDQSVVTSSFADLRAARVTKQHTNAHI